MNVIELLAIFDREQRRELTSHDMRCEVTPYVVRHVPQHPHSRWGWIVYSALTPANANPVIAEEIAFFQSRGLNFEWKWYSHDGPPDLRERLLAHGFEEEEEESVVVLDLEHAPSSLWLPGEEGIRRITDRAGLFDVVRIENSVWDDPHDWIIEELAHELAEEPEHLSIYCADVDGEPASAAWIRFHPGTHFASLWGGSTVPAYRKRGLYSALLAIRAREARQRGYRFLTVDASDMSRPILEKHGFVCITKTRPFKWRSAATP
jgi:GNAT superfamily N-acetyltransferase